MLHPVAIFSNGNIDLGDILNPSCFYLQIPMYNLRKLGLVVSEIISENESADGQRQIDNVITMFVFASMQERGTHGVFQSATSLKYHSRMISHPFTSYGRVRISDK